jgi:tRNA-specific 2-thiouridylase
VAVNLGFPHYILDIRGEFGDFIINNFVDEYLAGRTPNPCVLCNTHIKWEALLKRADMLACEFIATGHYAQVRKENGRYVVSRGLDLNKDQSYVLWGLSQESLQRTIFPLGKFTKPDIRKMAIEYGFAEIANKPESYDICFIPDNDYRKFLKHRMPDLEKKVEGGDFIFRNEKVGTHRGYPFYTIGQRKGLDIALGEPVFVKNIVPETNTVILGTKEDLNEQQLYIRDFNLIKYKTLPPDFVALTKIRYKDPGTPATLNIEGKRIHAVFHNVVSGVAPGQSAVMYEGDDLVGGGFIDRN